MRPFLLLIFFLIGVLSAQEMPFNRGVNITNWFQASGPQTIQFTKYTRNDFVQIKSLGCDVIRLPINLHNMTSGEPDYILDPIFLYFLDQVVSWAEAEEIHLILDNHTFDVTVDTDPDIGDILIPVWTQMADRYKTRSEYIYYEILNEPHGISDELWNSIQQNVVAAIRVVDTVHTIIVGPGEWNSYHHLDAMPVYADDNLIYTYHFYEPFLFTHQGANWTSPSMEPLAGVPFPYDESEMPDCPPELIGTWIESSLNNYVNEGTADYLLSQLEIVDDFRISRNVPVYCGEFGVYMPNADNADRNYWYYVTRYYLEQINSAWTIWDYKGGFGLFEPWTNELFDYDLNTGLLQALGLNVPPQYVYVLYPDSTAFDIYTDFTAENFVSEGSGDVAFYHENSYNGQYCIYWTHATQYENLRFQCNPVKDLSWLADNGFGVDLWVKGDTPGTRIVIRFLDTDNDIPEDHPWRMGLEINEELVNWDNNWQHLHIPLAHMEEMGAWEDGWFEPIGEFDWGAIDRLEIVAEYGDLNDAQLYFDDIKILNPSQTFIMENEQLPGKFKLYQNYPNPFNPSTRIEFYLPRRSFVTIDLYNTCGERVQTLVKKNYKPGVHSVQLNGSRLPSGVYFYRFKTEDFLQTRKCLLLK